MATQAETGYTPGSYPSTASSQQEGWQDRYRSEISRAVDDNPTGTLMTAFGVGLGIGTLIGLGVAFSTSKPQPRSRTEEFGQRILEALHDYLPDAVNRRFN